MSQGVGKVAASESNQHLWVKAAGLAASLWSRAHCKNFKGKPVRRHCLYTVCSQVVWSLIKPLRSHGMSKSWLRVSYISLSRAMAAPRSTFIPQSHPDWQMQACKRTCWNIHDLYISNCRQLIWLFILQIYLNNYSNIYVASKHVMDAFKVFTNVL